MVFVTNPFLDQDFVLNDVVKGENILLAHSLPGGPNHTCASLHFLLFCFFLQWLCKKHVLEILVFPPTPSNWAVIGQTSGRGREIGRGEYLVWSCALACFCCMDHRNNVIWFSYVSLFWCLHPVPFFIITFLQLLLHNVICLLLPCYWLHWNLFTVAAYYKLG